MTTTTPAAGGIPGLEYDAVNNRLLFNGEVLGSGPGPSGTLTGTIAGLLAMAPPAATTVAQGTDVVDCMLVSAGALWRGSVGTHESVEALALLSTALLEGGAVTAIIRGFGTALLSTDKSVWLVQPATPQITLEA